MRETLLSLGLAAIAGVAAFAPSNAAALTCDGWTVDPATACAGVYPGNDRDDVPGDQPTSVNDPNNDGNASDALFGVGPDSLWTVIDRDDSDDGENLLDGDFSYKFDGTWSLGASLWGTWDSMMIVLKQANEFYAFLLTDQATSGTWSTPSGIGQGGVSHLTLYGVEGDDETQVPEPGSLMLLSLGLLALGAARRRMAA